ncbi:MAG: hypothetical protein WCF92_02115 [bacterium]
MPEKHTHKEDIENNEHYLEKHLPEFLISINELLLTIDVTKDTLGRAQSYINAARNIIVGKTLAQTEEGVKVEEAIRNLEKWMEHHQ